MLFRSFHSKNRIFLSPYQMRGGGGSGHRLNFTHSIYITSMGLLPDEYEAHSLYSLREELAKQYALMYISQLNMTTHRL